MRTRREFLGAAAVGPLALGAGIKAAPAPADRYSLFTKHLLGLSHERVADLLADLGVTAIEAPIRPGGHVEPERVADDLPRFVEILKARGVRISILASSVNEVSKAQRSESILRVAKSLGIPRFRMLWYRYDPARPIPPQLDEIGAKLKDLVALAGEVGIRPCYQNHSGPRMVGGPIWDFAPLMARFAASRIDWCYDVTHARVEGGLSWPSGLDLVRERIGVAYFKDFVWKGKSVAMVPLGEGIAAKDFVAPLKAGGFAGPINLHVEHVEARKGEPDYLKHAVEATRRDLAVLKSWWS